MNFLQIKTTDKGLSRDCHRWGPPKAQRFNAAQHLFGLSLPKALRMRLDVLAHWDTFSLKEPVWALLLRRRLLLDLRALKTYYNAVHCIPVIQKRSVGASSSFGRTLPPNSGLGPEDGRSGLRAVPAKGSTRRCVERSPEWV